MKQPNDKISESVDIEEREYWDEEDDGLLVKNSKVNKEYGILLLFCSMNCFIQSISFFCIFLESSIKNQYFNSFNFSFTLVLLGYNCYYFILKSKECDFYYKNNEQENILLKKSQITVIEISTLRLFAFSLVTMIMFSIEKKINFFCFTYIICFIWLHLQMTKTNLDYNLEILISVLSAFSLNETLLLLFLKKVEIYVLIGLIFCSLMMTFNNSKDKNINLIFISCICLYQLNYYNNNDWFFKIPALLILFCLAKFLKSN